MIRYQKDGEAKITRMEAPEPPFWAATTIAPYSFPRSKPLALDYLGLLGTGIDKAEVRVCATAVGQVAREIPAGPILIDATERAESIYGCGSAIHRAIREQGEAAVIQLISANGSPPEVQVSPRSLIALSAWPLHLLDLRHLAGDLRSAGWHWGLVVPILFPATTELAVLEQLADLAQSEGAEFLTGVRFDLDPNARRVLATSTPTDDDTYSTLFDQGEESIAIATERHLSALAHERGLAETTFPPDQDERTNWNAAIVAGMAGIRLIGIGEDVELGWEFVRAARQLAALPKPLTTIAAAASLSIIETIPSQITDALEQWLPSGRAPLFDEINRRWRLRRDYGVRLK